jgi:hypothetical protein
VKAPESPSAPPVPTHETVKRGGVAQFLG